jgi:hypothetical protein
VFDIEHSAKLSIMSPTKRLSLVVAGVAATAALALPAAAGADGFPLMGWWPMNEGSGQVIHDWSGHGNNGQLGSTSGADASDPSWIPGVFFGSALRFDGNDFVQIPDSSSLEPAQITVSAWFRGSSSPGQYRYIVSKGSVACDRTSYGLYSSENGGLAFTVADGTKWYRSPEAPTSVWDGRWHNAAGTFDGSTLRLFIDGNEVGNGTPAHTAIAYGPPSGGGLIGDYHSADCDLFLTGDVDGVQIWSRPLPIADIWRFFRTLLTTSR